MARKASMAVFIILTTFMIMGNRLFEFFAITIDAFRIAGGLILLKIAMDMVEDSRHPLHTRHIARTTSDPAIVTAMRYLFEQWLHYGADAVGGRIEFDADAPVSDNPINIDLRTRGKRRLVE